MNRVLAGAILGMTLFTGPAYAADDAEVPGHADAPAAHGDAPHGDAADAAHEGGAHHADYMGDADGDGLFNAIDPDSDDFVLLKLVFHAINLLILLGVLFWFGRRPIGDAVKNRALGIRKTLTESAAERDAARSRFEELETRLAHFEDEVERMRTEAITAAKREEEKLIEHANQAAVRIAQTNERNIRDEVTRAKIALRREAVQLAVQLAENTLRNQIQPHDQQRLAREFLASLASEEGV